jgi:hypothetical protein
MAAAPANPPSRSTARRYDYVDGFAIQCRQGVLNSAPTITNPGSQNGGVGTAVDLAISASDVNGDPLTYSASGLPRA